VRAQTTAGWIALGAGLLLVVSIAAATLTGAFGPSVTGFGPMGPAMMGGGGMGPGMMGFGNAGPASTPIPGATEVRVQATNFSFTPNQVRLPEGGDVNLTLTNPASTGAMHDFTVPSLGIHIVANASETRTIGLRGLAAGRYDAYCSVPGHAELGMRATVIVE